MSSTALPAAAPHDEARGLLLGIVGVAIFALTLPMTRLAVGPAGDPQLPPLFVTAGRAAVAGVLSILWLRLTGAARPRRDQALAFFVCAAGTVIGFPLFLALALREVEAMHAAVITGVLPLGTALAAAIHHRQRPSAGFWASAAAGCALVLGFAVLAGGGRLVLADLWLLLAVACASIGYVAGAKLSTQMRAEAVIGWVLVASLPVTLPLALASLPAEPVRASAWFGFGYVALFSMWIGFFAWYRALALGGTVRVSQVQLLQPFLALLAAVPLLGERLEPLTLIFSLAVIGVVFIGRRMPVGRPGSP
jgi:drug/metabolite transporter (DMT)-like permease